MTPQEAADVVGKPVRVRDALGDDQGEGVLFAVEGWTAYVETDVGLMQWHVGYVDPAEASK